MVNYCNHERSLSTKQKIRLLGSVCKISWEQINAWTHAHTSRRMDRNKIRQHTSYNKYWIKVKCRHKVSAIGYSVCLYNTKSFCKTIITVLCASNKVLDTGLQPLRWGTCLRFFFFFNFLKLSKTEDWRKTHWLAGCAEVRSKEGLNVSRKLFFHSLHDVFSHAPHEQLRATLWMFSTS